MPPPRRRCPPSFSTASPRVTAALARRVAVLLNPVNGAAATAAATVSRRALRLANAIESPPRTTTSAFLWIDDVERALCVAADVGDRAARRWRGNGLGEKDCAALVGVANVLREWESSFLGLHHAVDEDWAEEGGKTVGGVEGIFGRGFDVPTRAWGKVDVRDDVFDTVKMDLMRIAAGESRLSVVGLVGGFGCGKSDMAAALAGDATLRDVFAHGVAWVALCPELGEAVFQGVLDSIVDMIGEVEIGEGNCLVVVDDVEGLLDEARLESIVALVRARVPFRSACVLFTSTGGERLEIVSDAIVHQILPLESADACAVFDAYARLSLVDKSHVTAVRRQVMRACRGDMLALALAGAALRKSAYAWGRIADVACGKEGKGVVESLLDWLASLCGPDFGLRLLSLSAIPSGAVVSLEVIALLWSVNAKEANSGMRRMHRYGIARLCVAPNGRTGLVLQRAVHDVCRSQEISVRPRQRRFIESLAKVGHLGEEHPETYRNWWRILGQSHYVDAWITFHLVTAGLEASLSWLLCDFRWICARTFAPGERLLADDFAALMLMVAKDSVRRREVEDYSHAVLAAAEFCNRDEAALAWHLSQVLSREKALQRNSFAHRAQALLYQHASRPCFREVHADSSRTRHSGFIAKLSACGRGRHPAAVSVGEDGHFRVWSLREWDAGKLLHDVASFRGSDYSVAIVSDGVVYAGGDDGVVRAFSVGKGKYDCSLVDHGQIAITALTVSRYGSGASEQVVVASGDAKGEVVLSLLSSGGSNQISHHKYTGCPDEVTALCILPKSRKLVVGNFEGYSAVWDWDTASDSRTPLIGHRDQVLQICALGGDLVASSCSKGSVYVWSTTPGSLLWRREVGFTMSPASLRRFCSFYYFCSTGREIPRVVKRHPFVLLREAFGRELFAVDIFDSALSKSNAKGASIFDVQITAVEEVLLRDEQLAENDSLLVLIGLEDGQLIVTELLCPSESNLSGRDRLEPATRLRQSKRF